MSTLNAQVIFTMIIEVNLLPTFTDGVPKVNYLA